MREGLPSFNPEASANKPIEGEYISDEQWQEHSKKKLQQENGEKSREVPAHIPEYYLEKLILNKHSAPDLDTYVLSGDAFDDDNFVSTPEGKDLIGDRFEIQSEYAMLSGQLGGLGEREPRLSDAEITQILLRNHQERMQKQTQSIAQRPVDSHREGNIQSSLQNVNSPEVMRGNRDL